MIIRVHKRGKEIVVAACDEELIDKTFRSGELRLHVSKRFYNGEPAEEEQLLKALRQCTTANLVGQKTIDAAIRAGYIDEDSVIFIEEVPHAQLFKML